ncbi:MAG: PDZ domain-containing protein [Pyrinomonadaceae bacterium]
MKRGTSKISSFRVAVLLAACSSLPGVLGQTVPTPPAKAPAAVVAESRVEAPQVVTIVHRINGIALLRLLGRMSGDMNTVATLNESFAITNEVHTNIIAGLALDDGKTIAAWLPRAKAELDAPIGFPSTPMPPNPDGNPGPGVSPALPSMASLPGFGSHLTVFGSDGRERKAVYLGFDAPTGLSVLRVGELSVAVPQKETEGRLINGQELRLFAPQSVAQTRTMPPGRVYVRIGANEVRVKQVTRNITGRIERLTASGSSLSPAVIGGVAIDDAGVTVGIVQGITGNEASIIPLDSIRKAAKRVIERRSSVPRPFLGVRGEAIASMPQSEFLLKGWSPEAANSLLQKRRGIMLSAVVPGTPAAFALLRPGDVILSINEQDVTSAQEFSSLIGQCEAATPVKFTVARPGRTAPEAITVKLTEVFNQTFKMEYQWPEFKAGQAAKPLPAPPPFALAPLGIETLAFSPRAAARLRAQGGRFVVWVDPASIAFRSGVREGDVIENIDMRTTVHRRPGGEALGQTNNTIVLRIVRNGQRIHVVMEKDDLKKN